MCVAPKLRSLHFAHPVYVASRYFQQNSRAIKPTFLSSERRAGVKSGCQIGDDRFTKEGKGTVLAPSSVRVIRRCPGALYVRATSILLEMITRETA